MARKAESVFRIRVKRDLATLSNTIVFPIQQMGIIGDPDLLCCIRGHFVALELKSNHGVSSALQRHKLRGVRDSGGTAYLVYPNMWDEIFSILKCISEGKL